MTPDVPTNPTQNSQNQINSPELDQQGKPTRRAISTAEQAFSVAKSIRDRALLTRIATAAEIAGDYNGRQPFNQSAMVAQGQGWRSNFSTNTLASQIDRTRPQFQNPIMSVETLTFAALPAEVENAAEKTKKYRDEFTNAVRSWTGFKDLVSHITQDNVLYGNTVVARLDDDWRPRYFRYDEIFLPEGTGQHSTKVPLAVFAQKMLLHEFVEILADKEVAEAAGYDWENCIKAANSANGNQQLSIDPTALEQADAMREGSWEYSQSFQADAKTVDLFYVVVQDYTGEVDMWVVTQDKGLKIQYIKKLHNRIADSMTLFTLQSGNGKYYGSKGQGRMLVNLARSIEKTRNLATDSMYLSSMLVLTADMKDMMMNNVQFRHPFIIIPKGAVLESESFKLNAEGLEMIDSKLTGIMDSISGAFIPPPMDASASPNTKIEAAQRAEREIAIKEGVLGRFFDQFSELIDMMARAMFSADNLKEGKRIYDEYKQKTDSGFRVIMRNVWNILKKVAGSTNKLAPMSETKIADEVAVNAVVEMLKGGLSIEEIAVLANTPSASAGDTQGAQKDMETLDYIANNQGNPFLNQRKMTEMAATIKIGEDRAREIMLDDEDPNVIAVATRQQLIEWSEMEAQVPMPVASIDNHAIHRKVMAPKMQDAISQMEQQPTELNVGLMELSITHYIEHVTQDTQTTEEDKKKEMEIMKVWQKATQEAGAMLEQQKQQQAQAQSQQTQQMPPGGQMQPGQQADPAMAEQVAQAAQMGADNKHREDEKASKDAVEAGRLALKMHELEQRDHELHLENRKFDHQQMKDAAMLQQSNLSLVADQADKARQSGIAEGDRDRENLR